MLWFTLIKLQLKFIERFANRLVLSFLVLIHHLKYQLCQLRLLTDYFARPRKQSSRGCTSLAHKMMRAIALVQPRQDDKATNESPIWWKTQRCAIGVGCVLGTLKTLSWICVHHVVRCPKNILYYQNIAKNFITTACILLQWYVQRFIAQDHCGSFLANAFWVSYNNFAESSPNSRAFGWANLQWLDIPLMYR